MCVCVCLKSSCGLCLRFSSWKSSPSSLYSTTFPPSLTSPPSQPDFNQWKQFSLWAPVPGHHVPLISDLLKVLHRQSMRNSASTSNKCSTFLNVNQSHLRGLVEVVQSRKSCCFHVQVLEDLLHRHYPPPPHAATCSMFRDHLRCRHMLAKIPFCS